MQHRVALPNDDATREMLRIIYVGLGRELPTDTADFDVTVRNPGRICALYGSVKRKNVLFIGLSATPLRQDLGRYFEPLVRGPTVAELTDAGFLVPTVAYALAQDAVRAALGDVRKIAGEKHVGADLSRALNRKGLIGDIVRTCQKKASGRRTLCFAVDIAHSQSIVEDFRDAGVVAVHIDHRTEDEDRQGLIGAFKRRNIQVLSSVAVLAIGFDVPSADCAILARPTLSASLDMQQKGRVLRPSDGKQNALILDHAGNTLRFGLRHHFEIPDLEQGEKPATSAKDNWQKVVLCHACEAVIGPDVRTWPHCGTDRPKRKTTVSYLDAELVQSASNDDGKRECTV